MARSSRTGGIGFVLLHGAELGAWVWDPLLGHLGRPALAVDLPGRNSSRGDRRKLSLEDAITSVVAQVTQWGAADRVVLVVHSFTGVLAPAVTQRLGDRVVAVVWLAATVPEAGKSWVDLLPQPQRTFLRVLYRLRPSGALSPRRDNLKNLANDLDELTAAVFVGRRVPEAAPIPPRPRSGGVPSGRGAVTRRPPAAGPCHRRCRPGELSGPPVRSPAPRSRHRSPADARPTGRAGCAARGSR